MGLEAWSWRTLLDLRFGPLKWWGPLGWPRMWRRWWSGANPSVVSPRGRGCSARKTGGKCSRGVTHSSIALSCSKGSGWRRCIGGSWVRAADRGRGGTAHPGPESESSMGLNHARATEGEGMERERGGGGGRQMKGFSELMALNAY